MADLYTEPHERNVLNACVCYLVGAGAMVFGGWFCLEPTPQEVDLQAMIATIFVTAFITANSFDQGSKWLRPRPKKPKGYHVEP